MKRGEGLPCKVILVGSNKPTFPAGQRFSACSYPCLDLLGLLAMRDNQLETSEVEFLMRKLLAPMPRQTV
jgi:hypothetical protein